MVGSRPQSARGKSSTASKSRIEDPPPYTSQTDSPMLLAETRTTEVVTTTTTTHLFSLPLLRRRLSSSGHGHGFAMNREKDLPPTPDASHVYPNPLAASSSQNLQNTRDAVPPSSTSTLAQLALGLGLPHTLPQQHTHPSGPFSEVNTVAFTPDPSPSPQTDSPPPRPTPRPRAITSHIKDDNGGPARRRTRGLSLNASALLSFGSSDSKNKSKDPSLTESPSPSPKVLSRKPSFWSRKKSIGTTSQEKPPSLPSRPRDALPLPQLPSFQPISPFEIDLSSRPTSPAPPSHMRHQRGLSRSNSERASSKRPINPERRSSLYPPPTPEATPHLRPSTADSALLGASPGDRYHPLSAGLVESPARSSAEDLLSVAPRRRSMTNPPLLQRLSMGLFSSNAVQNHTSSSNAPSPISGTPIHNSPRPSINKPTKAPSPPSENESPEVYLQRILMTVSKSEVASILATSVDTFHAEALRTYIRQFDFVDDPLDIALRKLLMDISLPRETQQIDRVMEAFAARYSECNQDLFVSEDHPYVLAFSLIMLHTDAFNKSNKRKMTKPDYIKNTRLPGVPPEVLDCFYDNIVFAPFIFIEDPLDVNGQPSDGFANRPISSSLVNTTPVGSSGSSLLSKAPKLDPYYLITHGHLGPLRVDVDSIIPPKNPYSFKGTEEDVQEDDLHRAFAKAAVLEVGGTVASSQHLSYSMGVVGTPPNPLMSTTTTFNDVPVSNGEVQSLRVTKVGVLNRKDDLVHGGKKSTNRKWKPWGVILTGSQILLFRDPSWAATLMAQWNELAGQVVLPQTTVLRPDELLSVKYAVAVFDTSYTRYNHTLRFVLPDNRHILLQAPDEHDLNEWITRINYASAFRSAGVRMRSLGMTGTDVELTGVAAASSHLHDMQNQEQSTNPRVHNWGNDAPDQLMEMLSGSPQTSPKIPQPKRRVTMMSGTSDMDFDVPSAPEVDSADQFKATFDQVKSELAAGNFAPLSDDDSVHEYYPDSSTDSLPLPPSALRTRAKIVQSKIDDFSAKAQAATAQLESDLRFVRNVRLLTPFQRSTHDRLVIAVQAVAWRIMLARLELTKFACYREVLTADLLAERRQWRQASKLALRRATEMLSSEAEKRGYVPGLPTMTISNPLEVDSPPPSEEHTSAPPSPDPSFTSPPASSSVEVNGQLETPLRVHHRPDSDVSISESFHSALDFPLWSSSDLASGSYLTTQMVDSPQPSSVSSSSYFPESQLPVVHEAEVTHSSEVTSPVHEKFYTARDSSSPEEDSVAEDWNKTRAAQRVSLVRVPSTFDMTVASRAGSWRRPNMDTNL